MEVEVGTLSISNDKNNVIAKNALSYFMCLSSKFEVQVEVRIFSGQYQLTQLYIRAGFSSPGQAPFFIICTGDSVGAGYHLRIMPRPEMG